jgi:hypothetical protein
LFVADLQDGDKMALLTTKRKKKTFEFDVDNDENPILDDPDGGCYGADG